MKKILLMALACMLISVGQAQEADKAQIKFAETIHHFDTLVQGDEAVCWFEFANEGTEPLLVTSAFSSCGCTVPEWSKEPIAPKQHGRIKVWYNTNKTGDFNKAVVVKTNSATEKNVVLRIKGVVTKQ
ncbi:MAG: DUF1573 domain-containing protein [Bacteroidales bacterium]|nr:DUF1573 domain-containing protein [Bacteroidales bacterium]